MKTEGQVRVAARNLDSKRRLVMPASLPPHSAVTIQRIDADTWIIKRQQPDRGFKTVLIPVIDKLPDDSAWEKKELELAKRAIARTPPFEE
jgi:hypothetical protein